MRGNVGNQTQTPNVTYVQFLGMIAAAADADALLPFHQRKVESVLQDLRRRGMGGGVVRASLRAEQRERLTHMRNECCCC